MQITLTLSQSLPTPLAGETYLCFFDSNGVGFTVETVGSGTTYICNITGTIPEALHGLRTGMGELSVSITYILLCM